MTMEIILRKAYKIKAVTILTGPRGRRTHHTRTIWEGHHGSGLNKAGWEIRERVRTGQEPLLGVRAEYTSKRHQRISLVNLYVTVREEQGGELVGENLITLVHFATQRVARCLFLGALRHQEHRFNTPLFNTGYGILLVLRKCE